jgi:hypothetical protein
LIAAIVRPINATIPITAQAFLAGDAALAGGPTG